jgi:DNA-binding LytR/AlgR family response regulator
MMLRETLRRLLEAAQRFEVKTPQYRRIASDRQALQEAITQAQLVLSVQDAPKEKAKNAASSLRSVPNRTSRKTAK